VERQVLKRFEEDESTSLQNTYFRSVKILSNQRKFFSYGDSNVLKLWDLEEYRIMRTKNFKTEKKIYSGC